VKHLISFKPQFIPLIESGIKCQTIRKERKRPIIPGDTLILCTGLRTKHYRRIKEVECSGIYRVEIRTNSIMLSGKYLFGGRLLQFIQDDGFDAQRDFYDFFRKQYGPQVFVGVVINWTDMG
jgi:hypothetical protein